MKTFKKDGVTYSVKQHLNNGVQYKAEYSENNGRTEAWAFIAGKKHARQQVIDAINEVNERSAELRYE
jgi:hypothetical protein